MVIRLSFRAYNEQLLPERTRFVGPLGKIYVAENLAPGTKVPELFACGQVMGKWGVRRNKEDASDRADEQVMGESPWGQINGARIC